MELSVGLIRGRHSVPDDIIDFVFCNDIPQEHICDSAYMEDICFKFFICKKPFNFDTVNVYVTGFTPALMALVKVCDYYDLHLNAYHYDREGKTFWKQEEI